MTTGGHYTYQTGPDGRIYAVSGEVSISASYSGSPEEIIRQAETVRRAALAPADPSPQDRQVAAQAAAVAARARSEHHSALREEQRQNTSRSRQDESHKPLDPESLQQGQKAIASFISVGALSSPHSNPAPIDEII
jgi:hypothetical protein